MTALTCSAYATDNIAYAFNHLCRGNTPIKYALFSPHDPIKPILLGLIEAESHQLTIALFRLTDRDIAHALIDAAHRGVFVEVIVDAGALETRFSKALQLLDAGIALYIFPPIDHKSYAHALMHNKVIIFHDTIAHKSLLWTGSLNFTVSATKYNQENVLILEDADLVTQYMDNFHHLKASCSRLSPNLITT
jgi:phosphatidylserine/phosphatidylglycerophosphate/cardiolipin synthase-like enzyme